jgi:transcription elongation factor Elf1
MSVMMENRDSGMRDKYIVKEVKMKFECPICETEGSISENDLAYPITKASCRQCGTILLVNPETGKIDAYKKPFKGTREFAISGSQTTDTAAAPPVLEMPTGKGSRDWTAIITVLVILIVLIAAGIYFAGHLDTLRQSFQSAAQLLEDLLRSGKTSI